MLVCEELLEDEDVPDSRMKLISSRKIIAEAPLEQDTPIWNELGAAAKPVRGLDCWKYVLIVEAAVARTAVPMTWSFTLMDSVQKPSLFGPSVNVLILYQ